MSQNKEDLKNKIIYRASYRGTKEMDILMLSFVQFIFKHIDDKDLKILDEFVNLNDETLISLKKGESSFNEKNPEMLKIIKKFKKYNL
tara:strand:+ start:958 stop:1221 length:264 start_codon:yes stop_codon:yes gene_type:complete